MILVLISARALFPSRTRKSSSQTRCGIAAASPRTYPYVIRRTQHVPLCPHISPYAVVLPLHSPLLASYTRPPRGARFICLLTRSFPGISGIPEIRRHQIIPVPSPYHISYIYRDTRAPTGNAHNIVKVHLHPYTGSGPFCPRDPFTEPAAAPESTRSPACQVPSFIR